MISYLEHDLGIFLSQNKIDQAKTLLMILFIIYFRMLIKVLTLNCWAIGYVPFMTKDRKARVRAIARYLTTRGNYDIVCLQELWTKADRSLIQEACQEVLPYTVSFYG